MFKMILLLGFLAFVIWILFFKKSSKTQNQNIDSMVECKKCKTFVLQNEAFFSNGFYFCSKECLLGEKQ